MNLAYLERCCPAVRVRNMARLRAEHAREADLIDCIQRVVTTPQRFVSPQLKVSPGLSRMSDGQADVVGS